MLTVSLVLLFILAVGSAVGMAPGRASDEPPATVTVTVTSQYRGVSARGWAGRFRHRTRQLQAARTDVRHVQRVWRPTVEYALRLASAVYGVPYRDLATVSRCESTWNPFATNGRQLGLFQLGWAPFGLSPFDPVANALSAAMTVKHDGSWRQWQCKP